MLSPRYLDGLSDELIEIYSQLENDILQDMARRIKRLGKVTDATQWQAKMLNEAGGLKGDVNRILRKYDKQVREQVEKTVTNALETSVKNDNRIFKEATGRTVSTANAQSMLSTIQKCHSDLSRLTLTTAATTQTQFVKEANRVYMDVQSGAFDYDTAMKSAADELAKQGIRTVQYENGKPVTRSVESAVRMNILTSVNQSAANMTLNNADELGAEKFEVSAHIGARPEHEEWQGGIYTREQLETVCGLGEATGLCGINCRHSFYPYFEGTEKHYTQDDLDEMAGEKVSFTDKDGNKRTITRYEGEQRLRSIERNIRKYKRQALTEEAAGADNTLARRKLGEWQANARNFTKQTGIARDSAREYVGTSGKQPTGLRENVNNARSATTSTTIKNKTSTSSATVMSSANSTSSFSFKTLTENEYKIAVEKSLNSITQKEAAQIDQHIADGRMRGYVRTANSRVINTTLRTKGLFALDTEDRKTVDTLRKAISLNTLEKDTILIRNVEPNYLTSVFGIKGKYGLLADFEDIKKDTSVINLIETTLSGKTITEKQFLSCSTDKERNYFNKKGITLEIHAPKGTHCYFPNNYNESETILDIGQKLKIISAKVNSERVNIVCELIGSIK